MICRNHVDVSEGVRRCSRCGSTFCRDCLVEIGGAPYCATCKTEQLLDVRSGVSGPLDLAPIGRRIWAYLADVFILYIVNIRDRNWSLESRCAAARRRSSVASVF